VGWACSAYGEKGSAYSVLIGKHERKRLRGRPKCRWEDNMEIIPDVKWGHELD
jgi:hypothetical protein